VPHYYDPRERTKIKQGLIFTVEPVINMGTWKHKIWKDGWTAVNLDLKRSAQFEHTVPVTQNAVEILTLPQQQSQPMMDQNNKKHIRQGNYTKSIDMV